MPHIIISYRRADSDAIAGRIRDRLASHFGEGSIFMDIDSIPFGIDFRERIKEALAENDVVVIAVIGPNWLGPGKDGHMRIMDETDPVRIEIETALRKGGPVIPVLVGGAQMPEPSDLPDSLKDFSYRNAAEVDAGRDFSWHVERLIRSIDALLARRAKPPPQGTAVVPPVPPVEPSPPRQRAPAPATAPPRPPGPAQTPVVPAAPQPSRSSRAPVFVAIAAAVVLLGGLVGLGAWFATKKTETATPPPKVAAPSQPRTEPKQPERPATGGAATTAGCKLPVPAIFTDDFTSPEAGWSLVDDVAYYIDGQLGLKAKLGQYIYVPYLPLRFKDVSVCATLRAPSREGAAEGVDGGVMFWGVDNSSFYIATVYGDASYAIARRASGQWVMITPKTPFSSIKPGPGAVNEILVTTKDHVGTLTINGVKVQDFRGQPPKEGSIVGVYAASGADQRDEWHIINVGFGDPDLPASAHPANPPTPQVGPNCKPLRSATLEDHFKPADAGWRIAPNMPISIADGQLVMRLEPNNFWQLVYWPLLYKSATACTRVKSPSKTAGADIAGAGLDFWASDYNNVYVASIFPNGTFSIYRRIAGGWVFIVNQKKFDAIKTGGDAINEVMVAYDGDLAALYINGQKAKEFRGQPPANGGSVGFYSSSAANESTEWRFLDIVVVESE